MAAAIELRSDFSGEDLRRLARASRDAKQVRRLLALAAILDGGTRTEAARIGGVGLQIIRDWVLRFNAEGPDGLIDRKAPGKTPTLEPVHRAALAKAVEDGPEPWRDGVVRWRLIDLVQWLWDEFQVSVSETTVGRELRALGFRKLSARPRHYAQDPEAIEAFKKASPSAWRRSAKRIRASA
jgi:transposase